MVIGIDKIAQVECLVAFAHSRIAGLSGKGQEGVEVFKDPTIQSEAVNSGKEMEEALKDLATIDIVNEKIGQGKGYIPCLYYNYYTKLSYLIDKHLGKDEPLIEGLIGFHLLVYAAEKGFINSDNLEYYKWVIDLYENDSYSKDESVKETVKRMRIVSENIFSDYLRKKKKGKK